MNGSVETRRDETETKNLKRNEGKLFYCYLYSLWSTEMRWLVAELGRQAASQTARFSHVKRPAWRPTTRPVAQPPNPTVTLDLQAFQIRKGTACIVPIINILPREIKKATHGSAMYSFKSPSAHHKNPFFLHRIATVRCREQQHQLTPSGRLGKTYWEESERSGHGRQRNERCRGLVANDAITKKFTVYV